jgi:predicted component of type VI protein secretion system
VERSFIVGVIGDFSGRGAGKVGGVLDVDRDGFDALFARLEPRIRVELPFCDELALDDWEQWRPEALVQRVPGLARLREARDNARDPERMRALIAESDVSVDLEPEAAPRAAAPAAPSGSGADLLDDLLSGGGAEGSGARMPSSVADPEFAALVEAIASPHAERIDHAGIAARQDVIDRELGRRLRALLHHPAFQRRESLWRSLRALVFGSETGEGLRIRMLDADLDGLRGEQAQPLRDEIFQRLEAEGRGLEGSRPFDLLVCDARVDGTTESDLALLGHLAGLAARAEVPCLLEAGRELWGLGPGAADFVEQGRPLRGAERIGLCGPDLLLRIPYGASADPVEGFRFEEVEEGGAEADYLWGGASFEVAAAMCEAVAETGRADEAPRFARREGLPFHPSGPGGEPAGSARALFTESEIDRLRELGVLALAGIRGRDAAVITSFSSLAGASLLTEG